MTTPPSIPAPPAPPPPPTPGAAPPQRARQMQILWLAVAVVVVASLAFVGTMTDNFFAFAAQLLVTEGGGYRLMPGDDAG